MFKHGAKAATGFFDNGIKIGPRVLPKGMSVPKALRGRKKLIAGAAGVGLLANGVRGRSGRAADRPNGRPTGPYMY